MAAPTTQTPTTKPIAVVTGGASGIGLEITKLLLSRGYHVIIADLNSALGQEVSSSLPNTAFLHCDASSWPSLAAVFKTVFQTYGRIDFVAANAGISEAPPYVYGTRPKEGEAAVEDEEPLKPNTKVLEVNMIGVVYTVNLAAHYMRRNPVSSDHTEKGGKIIVTASAVGIHPMPAAPLYSTAKHGTVGLVRSLAPFLSAQDNISISAICPAVTDTPLMHDSFTQWPPTITTTMATVMRGYETLVSYAGVDGAGKVLEMHGDDVVERGLLDEKVAADWREGAFMFVNGGKSIW
ncbi:MAG: hypothetical protein M1819_000396 [Sarea resinae]|nr:MAG: hypothetical protein M1819_000396 [Sarea resinae]